MKLQFTKAGIAALEFLLFIKTIKNDRGET